MLHAEGVEDNFKWRAPYVSASILHSLAAEDVSYVFFIQQCLNYLKTYFATDFTVPIYMSEAKPYSLLPDPASEPLMTTSWPLLQVRYQCYLTGYMLWEHHAGCMSHALVEQINDNCEGALRVGQHNTVTTVHTKHGCRMSLHMHACNLVVITVLLPSLVPVFIPILGVTEWKFEVTNSAYLHYLAVSIHT